MNANKHRQTAEADGNRRWQNSLYSNTVRHGPSGVYIARFRARGKLVSRSLKTDKITMSQQRLRNMQGEELRKVEAGKRLANGRLSVGNAIELYRARGFGPSTLGT